MSVRESTEVILYDLSRTATWLELADRYIQQYNANPVHFVLPKQHALIHPLVEAYAKDLEGFVNYLIGVRDSLDRRSSAYREVHALYRKINGRLVQQQRRERTSRAVAKATELYGEATYQQKQQWAAKMEHEWAKRRITFLEAARRGGGRVPQDEMNELLAEFWNDIDTEIYNGENIPRWET